MKKCNAMASYFDENQLTLNIDKSGYMVINGDFDKSGLGLNNGILKYVTSYVYLGYTLTDTGLVQEDIDQHISSKRGNSTFKFMNFCRSNYTAPLVIKLKVLDACVNSCYLYGCDVWGKSNYSKLEVLHRQALRTALSIRQSINNEIVYLESGQYPLSCTIQSRQLKYWLKMKTFLQENNDSYLNRLVTLARVQNLPYISYYDALVNNHGSPKNCATSLQNTIREKWSRKICNALADDIDSRLGVYKLINPDLAPASNNNIPEFERIVITRYRCGSHYLEIEKGRMQKRDREYRLCACREIQTLHHVVFDCSLIDRLPTRVTSLKDFFELESNVIANFLKNCEKVLRVRNT